MKNQKRKNYSGGMAEWRNGGNFWREGDSPPCFPIYHFIYTIFAKKENKPS